MGVIENVKEIADMVQRLGDIDLYRKIVELEQEVFELSRQNLKLQADIETLRELLTVKQNMKRVNEVYYVEGDSYPICPKCWEVDKLLVHLTESTSASYGHCPNCTNAFRIC